MKIGKRIKELRKEKKMTLNELSKKSGVAIATLSRMEHETMSGTLKSHTNICKALGVSVSDVYREIELDNKTISHTKGKDGYKIYVHSGKSSTEMLVAKTVAKEMTPLLIRIRPLAKTETEKDKPGTEKFIHILKGRLNVIFGDRIHEVSETDSLYFESSIPHAFHNTGKTEASLISVTTPPTV